MKQFKDTKVFWKKFLAIMLIFIRLLSDIILRRDESTALKLLERIYVQKIRVVSILVISLIVVLCYVSLPKSQDNQSTASSDFPTLTGPYLGQKLPGVTPEIFAPGIVSTKDNIEAHCTFSPDMKEFYFTRTDGLSYKGQSTIMVCRMVEGLWQEPKAASFSGQSEDYIDTSPHYSSDGKTMLFVRYSRTDTTFSSGIWITELSQGKWGNPRFLAQGTYPTITIDSLIYYSLWSDAGDRALFRSLFVNGHITEPELLGSGINTPYYENHPYVAPDESYLIFDSDRHALNPGSQQVMDLYVSFRSKDGSWTEPIQFGKGLGNARKAQAHVSPDGKLLFYHSNKDIYWVDAKIIDRLKPDELK